MTVRVCAEYGQTCQGQVDLAIREVELAAWAKADMVKFQHLRPERLAARDAGKYWHDRLGTRTQREAFALAGMIDYRAWQPVKDACDGLGVEFLSSPFDLEAVHALADLGCRTVKIASGELTHRQLIQACARTGMRLVLSTGAAELWEIGRALEWVDEAARDVEPVVLACTLAYPTPAGSAHLGRIDTLRRMWPQYDVGYSDHTSLADTALAAAAAGATLLEVHCTYDRDGPNVPDHRMGLDLVGLAGYVQAAHRGVLLRGDDVVSPSPLEEAARVGARRSLHTVRPVAAGEVWGPEMLVALRPCPSSGYEPWEARMLYGTAAVRDYREGEVVGR